MKFDKFGVAFVVVAAAVGGVTAGIALATPSGGEDKVRASIGAVFDADRIQSVDCGVGPGVCEVVVNGEIFYADRSGRYGFTGSMVDFVEQKDLTRERRAQVQQFATLLGGGAPQAAAAPQAPSPSTAVRPAQPQQPSMPASVDVTLPVENAVVYNGGQGLPVINIFADLACGYCQRLHAELDGLEGYEVREYFVDWLGSGRDRARLVLCADDRAEAATSMYANGSTSITRPYEECAEYDQVINANTAFARSFGMRGTPTIVMGDGRRFPGGYAPAEEIVAFAEQGQS